MNPASRKLGELLVDRRLIGKDALETVLNKEAETGIPLAKLLTDDGHVREEDLLRTVAERVSMPYVELDDELLDPEAVAASAGDTARELHSMPVKLDGDELLVAVADPFDAERHRRLEQASGKKVLLALSTKDSIQRALDFVHGPEDVPVLGSQAFQPRSTTCPTANCMSTRYCTSWSTGVVQTCISPLDQSHRFVFMVTSFN